MSQNSKIGKIVSYDALSHVPDHIIRIEAAKRSENALSQIVKAQSPNQQKISLREWKNAVAAAQNADFPNFNPLYDVYENIRIDLQLSSALETRILRVQQAKFNLVDKNGKPDTEAKKLLEKQWFLDFLKEAMESIYEGYRLIEHIDIDETGELSICKAVNKYNVKQKLGIVTKERTDDTGVSYLDGNYQLYYTPVGDKDALGILYKVAPMILAIKYAIAQWGEFNEKLGIPFRTVTTNAADSKRQQQLGIIMENMGSAGWAVLTEGEKVELLEMSQTDPTKCFESLIALLDARIATYLLGQSSTTSSDKNKGTYGSLQVLQEITSDRHEADLTFIKILINDVLFKKLPLISSNYRSLLNLRLDWDKSVEHTPQEVVELVSSLENNFEVDPVWVQEKTGIPILRRKQNTSGTIPPIDPKKKSSAMIAQLYEQQCDHCKVVEAADMPDFEQLMLNAARAIFDGQQKGLLDNRLLSATAKYLMTGITGGYGVSENDTDVKMIASLRKNVWVFSGFKTYETLREVTDKLVDDKGTLRLWDDFKKEVLKVNQNYNVTYLRAEYDNALVGAKMASYWQEIQANKKTLPYLKFVATEDNRTTQICRSLDGITLPVDHPFWTQYFLPLHWGERSLIQQVSSGKVTTAGELQDRIGLVESKVAEMFKQNVGISGVAFPNTHPYFEQAKAVSKKIEEESVRQFNYSKPRAEQFKEVYKAKATSATVKSHFDFEKSNPEDSRLILSSAKVYAKAGESMELLPALNAKDPNRVVIYGDLEKSNPDMKGLDFYVDIKAPQNFDQVTSKANRASKQGAIACIVDDKLKFTKKDIANMAARIWNSGHYKQDRIDFIIKNKLYIEKKNGKK